MIFGVGGKSKSNAWYLGWAYGAKDVPPTPTRSFFRVSWRPSTKNRGIYQRKPGFPENTLKKTVFGVGGKALPLPTRHPARMLPARLGIEPFFDDRGATRVVPLLSLCQSLQILRRVKRWFQLAPILPRISWSHRKISSRSSSPV